MKAINVSKTVHIPRITLNRLWLAIATVLRFLNRGYDDYGIRELMGELTPAELAAEAAEDKAFRAQKDAELDWWGSV